MEIYCISVDAPTKSFRVTVPSAVGVHDTSEPLPAVNLLGNKETSKGFWTDTLPALAATASSTTSNVTLDSHDEDMGKSHDIAME